MCSNTGENYSEICDCVPCQGILLEHPVSLWHCRGVRKMGANGNCKNSMVLKDESDNWRGGLWVVGVLSSDLCHWGSGRAARSTELNPILTLERRGTSQGNNEDATDGIDAPCQRGVAAAGAGGGGDGVDNWARATFDGIAGWEQSTQGGTAILPTTPPFGHQEGAKAYQYQPPFRKLRSQDL